MLLYERFLGRPLPGTEILSASLLEIVLSQQSKTFSARQGSATERQKRAERIPGFDQTPDFIIPSEFNPQGQKGEDGSRGDLFLESELEIRSKQK